MIKYVENTDVKIISVNRYEKFLLVLSSFRWTKLFLLHKTRVAIRFRAKTKLIMHTDYPKFIGMPAVWTDGRWSEYGHVITKFSGMGRLP